MKRLLVCLVFVLTGCSRSHVRASLGDAAGGGSQDAGPASTTCVQQTSAPDTELLIAGNAGFAEVMDSLTGVRRALGSSVTVEAMRSAAASPTGRHLLDINVGIALGVGGGRAWRMIDVDTGDTWNPLVALARLSPTDLCLRLGETPGPNRAIIAEVSWLGTGSHAVVMCVDLDCAFCDRLPHPLATSTWLIAARADSPEAVRRLETTSCETIEPFPDGCGLRGTLCAPTPEHVFNWYGLPSGHTHSGAPRDGAMRTRTWLARSGDVVVQNPLFGLIAVEEVFGRRGFLPTSGFAPVSTDRRDWVLGANGDASRFELVHLRTGESRPVALAENVRAHPSFFAASPAGNYFAMLAAPPRLQASLYVTPTQGAPKWTLVPWPSAAVQELSFSANGENLLVRGAEDSFVFRMSDNTLVRRISATSLAWRHRPRVGL